MTRLIHIKKITSQLIALLLLISLGSCMSSMSGTSPIASQPFDASGYVTLSLELSVIQSGFAFIEDLYISPSGQVYIVDSSRHYIYRLNPVDATIDSLGGQGVGNYQFNRPVSIDATNDLKIFVSDRGNRRIQMFDRRFQYLGSFQKQDQRGRQVSYEPTILCVNQLGELHFWDEDTSTLIKSTGNLSHNEQFSPNTSFLARSPSDCVISEATILLVDAVAGSIHRYNEFGRYIGFLGGFGNVRSLAITGQSLWLLTDNYILKSGLNGSIEKVYIMDDAGIVGLRSHGNQLYLYSTSSIFTAPAD